MRWAWHLSCSLFHLGGGRGVALILLPSPLGVSFYSPCHDSFACFACLDSSRQLPSPDDSVQGSHPRSAALLSDTARVLSPFAMGSEASDSARQRENALLHLSTPSSLRLVGCDAKDEDTSCLCWFHANLDSLGHGLETWTLECPFNIKFPKKCSVSLVQWHGTDMHRIDIQVHVIVLKAILNLKHIGQHLKHHQASYANIHNFKQYIYTYIYLFICLFIFIFIFISAAYSRVTSPKISPSKIVQKHLDGFGHQTQNMTCWKCWMTQGGFHSFLSLWRTGAYSTSMFWMLRHLVFSCHHIWWIHFFLHFCFPITFNWLYRKWHMQPNPCPLQFKQLRNCTLIIGQRGSEGGPTPFVKGGLKGGA